jgi:SAM-dependent methyltransferase
MSYAYSRYLTAKRTVDDRALNQHVLAELRRLLPPTAPRVLEIGAGLGTMVARLLDWDVLRAGDYTLLDVDPRLLQDSRSWLAEWATVRGLPTEQLPDGLRLGDVRVRLVQAELGDHLAAGAAGQVDLLIAHAFLDLVDLPTVLPGLVGSLVPGGVYWFTINFDGETIFSPEHPGDAEVLGAYAGAMDQRVRYGRPAGGSRSGRRLFGQLRAAGAPALASGSSDWVVHAGPDGAYAHDEAHFLACILQTVADAVADRVPADVLADWTAVRRRQLADGELVYIAHQLDYTGRARASA